MPAVVINATHRGINWLNPEDLKAPITTKTSPINPEKAGMPMLAKKPTIANATYRGIGLTNPAKSSRLRLWVRS